MIGSGGWPLGEKIPAEPELMAALGVSRNTVREAARALVHAGLLDARPGDGTYVTATDGLGAALAAEDRDTYLEAELAFHAAVADTAHNALLSQLYAQMTASVRESIDFGLDVGMAGAAHFTLHDTLLDAIAAQDATRAEAAATRHLASAAAAVSRMTDEGRYARED